MKRTFILLSILVLLFSVPFSASAAGDVTAELQERNHMDYDSVTDGTWVPIDGLNIEFWYSDSMFGLSSASEDEFDDPTIIAYLTYVVDYSEIYISAYRSDLDCEAYFEELRKQYENGDLSSLEFFLLDGMPSALCTAEFDGEFGKYLDVCTGDNLYLGFMYFGTLPEDEESIFTFLAEKTLFSVRRPK